MITIRARDERIGVTCGDVIDSISHHLNQLSPSSEFLALPREKQRVLSEAYRHNRSREHGVPGGTLGEGMKRLDWLLQQCIFGGLRRNPELVRKVCGGVRPESQGKDLPPCIFELICERRYPMTQKEIAEQQARQRAVEEDTRRSREAEEMEARDLADRVGALDVGGPSSERSENRDRGRSRRRSRPVSGVTIESVPDEDDRHSRRG